MQQIIITCAECGKAISPQEVRIFVPEDCDKDIGRCGWFHRDCGIEAEVGEDGLLFEQNVDRLFAILNSVLADWSDSEPVLQDMLPQINSAVAKLNEEVKTKWLSPAFKRLCEDYNTRAMREEISFGEQGTAIELAEAIEYGYVKSIPEAEEFVRDRWRDRDRKACWWPEDLVQYLARQVMQQLRPNGN